LRGYRRRPPFGYSLTYFTDFLSKLLRNLYFFSYGGKTMTTTATEPTTAQHQGWNALKIKCLCVLLCEDQLGNQGKLLTAEELANITGCSLNSVRNSLHRWVKFRYINRYQRYDAFRYGIAPHGLATLKSYSRGFLRYGHGKPPKWIQLPVVEVLKEVIEGNSRYSSLTYLLGG
jgi:hypothetical protein